MSPADRLELLNKRRAAYAVLGGRARAALLTPERRTEIARDAANVRWHGAPRTVEPTLEAGGLGAEPPANVAVQTYTEKLEALYEATPPPVDADGYPKEAVIL